MAEGFDPDVVYTSRLKRAIKSTWVILEELSALYLPVFKTVRLNQRHYGALQGLSKQETVRQVGIATVKAWRSSLRARPPPLAETDPSHPRFDRRYSDLLDPLPSTESLLDCQARARPLWEHRIKADLKQGKTVLVVAHRDSLRGLCKVIDNIGDADIQDIKFPKGIPFVYRFEKPIGGRHDGGIKTLKPDPKNSLTQIHTTGSFLETPSSLETAIKQIDDASSINIYLGLSEEELNKKRDNSLKVTLERLRGSSPVTYKHTEAMDDDNDVSYSSTRQPEIDRWNDDPSVFEEYEYDEFDDGSGADETPINIASFRSPTSSTYQGMRSIFQDGEPFVVLVRHGRTPHNNLGLFTGWEDPPLAEGGVEDARNAGKILKK
jgi:2,3-bisphosphoglycerate-dependent phosphoglycerate mutase